MPKAFITTPDRPRIYMSTRIYLILPLTKLLKFTYINYTVADFWTKDGIELQKIRDMQENLLRLAMEWLLIYVHKETNAFGIFNNKKLWKYNSIYD